MTEHNERSDPVGSPEWLDQVHVNCCFRKTPNSFTNHWVRTRQAEHERIAVEQAQELADWERELLAAVQAERVARQASLYSQAAQRVWNSPELRHLREL